MGIDLDLLLVCAVVAASVSAVSFTVTKTKIFAPFRKRVQQRSQWFGGLVGCPYCLSHWLALAAVVTLNLNVLQASGVQSMLGYPVTWMGMVAFSALITGQIHRAIAPPVAPASAAPAPAVHNPKPVAAAQPRQIPASAPKGSYSPPRTVPYDGRGEPKAKFDYCEGTTPGRSKHPQCEELLDHYAHLLGAEPQTYTRVKTSEKPPEIPHVRPATPGPSPLERPVTTRSAARTAAQYADVRRLSKEFDE